MLQCSKRQKVVDRSAGLTVLQCVNRKSGAFGNEVNDDMCSLCPVRAFTRVRPCKSAGPAIPSQPSVERTRETDQETLAMLKDSPLQDAEDIEFLEEASGDPNAPEYPAVGMQLWLYKEALVKWNKAGRPTRTDEEVAAIHDNHCKPCSWYDAKAKRCKGCGCKVGVGTIAVFNKIRMATEHCPKEIW